MKKLLFLLPLLFQSAGTHAASTVVELATASPLPIVSTHAEKEYFSDIWETQVVTNVVEPTLEIFQPSDSMRSGAAIIIAPGGGLYAHSIESEGRMVAHWLADKGVTAVVLKYRLVPTAEDGVAQISAEWGENYQTVLDKVDQVLPHSIADGLGAIEYVRRNAETLKVDPAKIGFMGFSAGGAVTMGVSYQYSALSRPDFVIPVYPWTDALDIQTPKADAPPMVIICASDDELGLAKGAIELYESYFDNGKNVALHMYSKGGHGFGMKQQDLPSDKWIAQVYDWLGAEGWLD